MSKKSDNMDRLKNRNVCMHDQLEEHLYEYMNELIVKHGVINFTESMFRICKPLRAGHPIEELFADMAIQKLNEFTIRNVEEKQNNEQTTDPDQH